MYSEQCISAEHHVDVLLLEIDERLVDLHVVREVRVDGRAHLLEAPVVARRERTRLRTQRQRARALRRLRLSRNIHTYVQHYVN